MKQILIPGMGTIRKGVTILFKNFNKYSKGVVVYVYDNLHAVKVEYNNVILTVKLNQIVNIVRGIT